MSNILPPPSTSVPAVQSHDGHTMSDFTPVWRKWFIDLAAIINKSGGTGGSVSTSRTITTTSPLQGGGNFSADLTLSFGTQTAHYALMGPSGGAANAPNFRPIVAADLPGVSHTVALAKLTGGGANGSLTFTNGILTAYVDPT